MRTAICKRLGCETPIFAFSHCRDVVVEVTRAGGFGVLGAATFSPEQLEVELAWIDRHTDGKPYGVDVIIPSTYDAEAERLRTARPVGVFARRADGRVLLDARSLLLEDLPTVAAAVRAALA